MSNYHNVSTIYYKTKAIFSHTFWVYVVATRNFFPIALYNSRPSILKSKKMGENRHRYEPNNCKEWKQKEVIWNIL